MPLCGRFSVDNNNVDFGSVKVEAILNGPCVRARGMMGCKFEDTCGAAEGSFFDMLERTNLFLTTKPYHVLASPGRHVTVLDVFIESSCVRPAVSSLRQGQVGCVSRSRWWARGGIMTVDYDA